MRRSVTSNVTDVPHPFPLTLEACLKAQISDSAVVDALVAEFVEKAAKSLSANGYEFSPDDIRKMLNERVSVTGESETPPDSDEDLGVDRMDEDEFDRQRAEINTTYADGRIVKLEEHIVGLERLLADREVAVKELEAVKRAAQKSLGDQGNEIRRLQGLVERATAAGNEAALQNRRATTQADHAIATGGQAIAELKEMIEELYQARARITELEAETARLKV